MHLSHNERVIVDFSSGDFVSAPDFGPLTRSVMPLIHMQNGIARAVGTCFAISNDGLCLTACHVVDEALPRPLRCNVPNTEADGWLYALYASDEPHDENPDQFVGGLLPAHKVHTIGSLDIAAVQLELPRNSKTGELLRMPASKIGLAPPLPQLKCIAFGYHTMEWSGADPNFRVSHLFYCSQGAVEEIHIPRRDAVMAPFPCFRTSARYDAGMSGGPVIGEDGLVRGVVCSSIQGLNSDDGYTSYVSLIGPSALIQVERLNEDGVVTRYFIGDLIERKIVPADLTGTRFERSARELVFHIGGGVIRNSMEEAAE